MSYLNKQKNSRRGFPENKTGYFKVPGLGNVAIGINDIQESGIMFGVCDVALVYSAILAEGMKVKAEYAKKERNAGVLTCVKINASNVWAINRAQEHGCSYCFAR